MGNKYYVYALLDSSKKGTYYYKDSYENEYIFEAEPFYIGKGCGPRYKESAKYRSYPDKPDSYKDKKILKLNENNIDIISLKIIENLSEDESYLYEIELIKSIGRRQLKVGPLTNLTDGGEGTSGSIVPIEKREFMSKTQKGEGNYFYGHNHTEEVKDNHSELVSGMNHPMYGKKHTEENRKIMKAARNKVPSWVIKEACKNNRKRVDMYDLDMNYIRTYDSVDDAADDIKIMNSSIISKCCRGLILNPTRYFFKYKVENNDYSIYTKNNKYLLTPGTIFNIHKMGKFEVVKHNPRSIIARNIETDDLETIRHRKYPFIQYKDTIDIEFVQLFLFIKKIYKKIKMDRENHLLYCHDKKILIYYNKLLHNCEILKDKYDIFNRYENREDGYKVINIFEDTWRLKEDIIKSRLENIFGIITNKIYGRKCIIKEITNKEAEPFFKENHIQGHVKARIYIGLYHEDKLISCMSFGKGRGCTSSKGEVDEYEMYRLASLRNNIVIGGASKMFKYFLNEYKPKYVYSFADRCWSDGDIYKTLNFTLSTTTKPIPNYYYIVDGIRIHRYVYTKGKLVADGFDENMTEIEIQHSREYFRIFDCGSYKFEYFK